MKKTYLIPAMEYLDIQTSSICEGSAKPNPMEDTQQMPDALAPRHL